LKVGCAKRRREEVWSRRNWPANFLRNDFQLPPKPLYELTAYILHLELYKKPTSGALRETSKSRTLKRLKLNSARGQVAALRKSRPT